MSERKPSIFERSKSLTRHPLDFPFACGFDPAGKSTKEYRVHIANCRDKECRKALTRWLDLGEYFRDFSRTGCGKVSPHHRGAAY